MISKQEFQDVVAQINNRFEWFTGECKRLNDEIVLLTARLDAPPPVDATPTVVGGGSNKLGARPKPKTKAKTSGK